MTTCRVAGYFLSLLPLVPVLLGAQGIAPYADAITDGVLHSKTPLPPPSVNSVFKDPDFGSEMVRVTDENTNPRHPLSVFRNAATETSLFSADASKFYVVGESAHGAALLTFAFDPLTMEVSSLPGAGPGPGLQLPLRGGATFSFVNPDVIFGETPATPLTVVSYQFSSASTTPVFDASACGSQPALVPGLHVVLGDLSVSVQDARFAVTAGGNQFGNRVFVMVYDTQLGCRWYNTQTGEIGGQWGATGAAQVPQDFLIRHAYISGSGRYVKISVDRVGFFVWDVATLKVTACYYHTSSVCSGYGALGNTTYINERNGVSDMDTLQRSLATPDEFTSLVSPAPAYFGMERHFAWSNGHLNDTLPVCGSTYSQSGNPEVKQPYDAEIFCLETDGLGSTIWRFAHNRAIWDSEYYWTEPFGNISPDGRFFLFTSGWDGQVGVDSNGDPRTDTWIVRLQ